MEEGGDVAGSLLGDAYWPIYIYVLGSGGYNRCGYNSNAIRTVVIQLTDFECGGHLGTWCVKW